MSAEPKRVEIDRARLHLAVWAAPIDKAAETLKVTSTTLRRLAQILNVPLPGRGSWMNGIKPRAKPLPPRDDGGPESVWLVPGRKHLVLEHDPQAAKHAEAPAAVPEGLHPIVARAARHYVRPLLGADGTMKPRASAAPSMRVSVGLRDRAIAFADLLVRVLEEKGCKATWSGPLSVETPDGEVALWIREETESVERPPTSAEAERERDRMVLGGPRKYFVERPTGRLLLAVRDPNFGMMTAHIWRDEGKHLIERRVKDIMRELLDYQRTRRHAELEKQAIEDADAREEAKRMLDEQVREIEEAQRKRLAEEIAAWERAATIHRYADALEGAHRERHGSELPKEAADWLAWMRRYADDVDPTWLGD